MKWAFWPNISFIVVSGSNCKQRDYQKVFEGWRCSDLGHENLRGWMLICVDHLIGDWAQAARPWTIVLWCKVCNF